MADPTPTREDTVKANVLAVETRLGPEAYDQINVQLLKDINISLAMLVDNSSSSSSSSAES